LHNLTEKVETVNSKKRRRRRLDRLIHQQANLCHWCKEPMQPVPRPGPVPHKRAATLDHLYSRGDPQRPRHTRGIDLTKQPCVAACFECNQERALAHQVWLQVHGKSPLTGLGLSAIAATP
jgi:hypothetical protein